MKWLSVFGPAILLCFISFAMPSRQFKPCLQEGIKLTDIVSVRTLKSGPDGPVVKKISVNDKLVELRASCKEGKLGDGSGQEIRFYRLAGCWGNPPEDYSEILDRQQNELSELKKRYNVIEIPCDSSGAPKAIH